MLDMHNYCTTRDIPFFVSYRNGARILRLESLDDLLRSLQCIVQESREMLIYTLHNFEPM